MFHRITVREEDSEAQRFVWWNKEENDISVFKLKVLSFGATCSPCIAHFVRNRNATLNAADNSRAVEAITQHHYVDDFIDSTNTIDEAIALAKNVRDIHARGGFHMRNWLSNSPEVLNALTENNNLENKTFSRSDSPTEYEKVLGMYWDPEADVFRYILKFVHLKRDILCQDIVPTKREVLRVLMSVFDPIGFLSCVMTYLKMLLQGIWRCAMEWDEEIKADLYEKWRDWVSYLPLITSVIIPRCYSPKMELKGCTVQLHTFVDASENACAAVSYFRIEYGGETEIRIVAAKTKVAPLRPLSIPRLELQAAVIGARLAQTIKNEHKIEFEKSILWIDSKTVLNWINNDSRQFQQYVMFRVAEIHTLTDLSEWRWIPTKLNVADIATKNTPAVIIHDQWINGPRFLHQAESEWPVCNDLGKIDSSEMRPQFLYIRNLVTVQVNFAYFSSWFRLYRAVANWILFIEKLYGRIKKQNLNLTISSQHLRRAKIFLYKVAQMTCFSDEWTAIKSGRQSPKESVLYKLNIYLDDDDVIYLKNRAEKLPLADRYARNYIVLPSDHLITRLVIDHYHKAYHHMNHETVINEVRQIYFIPRLRPLYKSVRRLCQTCKISNAKSQAPFIASLPRERLSAFTRPFSHVGIDYFGPIIVTENRKTKKRWGMLLTCLTVRAIHIEIAHSLSTDSCLMCLRNFVARRGIPITIYSDNGTNFRGAERLLREELNNRNSAEMQRKLAYEGINWKFNPPAAPHMGGVWERLVRSTKTILYKLFPSQKFTDESLRSALLEVELIVNSRPLTYVSLENEDQEAITPNHFLLGSSNGAKPFCEFENIDYKMNLRQSEAFSNMFWRRWLKEMLPTFTRRSKWFQKVKPIAVGDIVLVVDETQPRNTWLKGKVIQTIVAHDGQVRRATVQTAEGVLVRPAVKLAVLDIGSI